MLSYLICASAVVILQYMSNDIKLQPFSREKTMNKSILIGNQDETRPEHSCDTVLRFLADHIYKTSGYENLIPTAETRGLTTKKTDCPVYFHLYHSFKTFTCIGKALRMDDFKFNKWEILHNDGDNNTPRFFEINLFQGDTTHTEFCKKNDKGTTKDSLIAKNYLKPSKDYPHYIFSNVTRYDHYISFLNDLMSGVKSGEFTIKTLPFVSITNWINRIAK